MLDFCAGRRVGVGVGTGVGVGVGVGERGGVGVAKGSGEAETTKKGSSEVRSGVGSGALEPSGVASPTAVPSVASGSSVAESVGAVVLVNSEPEGSTDSSVSQPVKQEMSIITNKQSEISFFIKSLLKKYSCLYIIFIPLKKSYVNWNIYQNR